MGRVGDWKQNFSWCGLIWYIFSVESDGEGPWSKFEQEDSQTDSGKGGKCERFVMLVVPPRNHARSRERFEMSMTSQN